MKRRVEIQRKCYVEWTSEESKWYILSANWAIKERNWCCGANRVTVKSEDTKWKDQLYLESIPGEVTGAFPSLDCV